MTGVRSPSKFTPVDRLEAIRRDNYLGQAVEYSAEELDRLIHVKRQSYADRKERELIRSQSERAWIELFETGQPTRSTPPRPNLVMLVNTELMGELA